jgi:hypothetical protein
MSSTVKCAKCGNENDLNRIFCVKCGAKLDLSKVTAATARIRRPSGALRGLVRAIRLLVSCLVLVAAILIVWPVRPTGQTGRAAEARQMRAKLDNLIAAPEMGRVVSEVVTEAEVNGYLADLVSRNQGASPSEGMRLGVEGINMTFTSGRFVAHILAKWGPLSLSYEVKGSAGVQADRLDVRVAGARWGHLPLPGPAAAIVSRRVSAVFSRLDREREMLDGLSRLDLGRGAVRLVTRGTSGP